MRKWEYFTSRFSLPKKRSDPTTQLSHKPDDDGSDIPPPLPPHRAGPIASPGATPPPPPIRAHLAERDSATIGPGDDAPLREERDWLANVYQGDTVRQLSVRAIVTGMLIGAVMSISNLYVGLKTGWGLGVTITACIIGYGHIGSQLSVLAEALGEAHLLRGLEEGGFDQLPGLVSHVGTENEEIIPVPVNRATIEVALAEYREHHKLRLGLALQLGAIFLNPGDAVGHHDLFDAVLQ